MEPTVHTLSNEGIQLCAFEWGQRTPGKPTYVLVHATGFHARCWDRVVGYLGDRHVITLDQRGHGRSDAPPITHWDVFGRDLTAVLERLDLQDVVGGGRGREPRPVGDPSPGSAAVPIPNHQLFEEAARQDTTWTANKGWRR